MSLQTHNKQQLKKINARVEKWRLMINEGVFRNPQLLQIRVWKGIPSSMRMLAWPHIISLDKFIQKSQDNYVKLINQFSNSIYDIGLDIRRTFPQYKIDEQCIKSDLDYLPKNWILPRLLEVLDDQTTFWLLHYCLYHDQNIRNLFIDPSSITKQTFVFEKLINEYLPTIGNKFHEQLLNLVPFTLKWFIPLCSSIFEEELFCRIFEIYLIEGWKIFYAVGLSLLKLHENQILDNRPQENCTLLSKKLRVSNINQFILLVKSFNLQRSKIGKIQNQFIETNDKFVQKRNALIKERQEVNKNFKGYKPRNQSITQLNIQNQTEVWQITGLKCLKLSS